MCEYIGVEIGGTKQQIGSFNEKGEKLMSVSVKLQLKNGAEDIRCWIKEKLPEFITSETKGIGVGFGGILDSRTGVTDCSVHVKGWDLFPLKKWFEENFNLPAVVVNDTVCGGYAEVLFGEGRGVDLFFYTNIGTGIGGAFFVKGKNYDGTGMGGAYLGQIFVPSWSGKDDKTVRMETLCSGVSIEKRIRQPGYIPNESLVMKMCGGDFTKATCTQLCEAASQNDPFAAAELDRWAERYSLALANFTAIMAPEKIAIGGGVAKSGEVVLSRIRRETEKLAFCSVKGRYEIVQCKTMDDAVLLGAAMYARDGFYRI